MAENIVVYTAITGDYDELQRAPPGDVRKIAYLDRSPEDKKGWEILIVDPRRGDVPVRTARFIKALSHNHVPEWCDISIWLDGKVELTRDPRELVEEWLEDCDIATFLHPARHCVYDEATHLLWWKIGDPKKIKAQMTAYHKEGYPFGKGLAETRVVVRRHTPEVKAFNELWWAQISKYSVRDQLSFPYCLWKTWLDCKMVGMGTVWFHQDFEFYGHKGQPGMNLRILGTR